MINKDATLIVANLVADSLSKGFFINSKIPRLSEIKDMITRTRKSIFDGNRLVNGINMKERVANNPEIAISLKPNSRPHDTIQVILPPILSPSISGISKLLMNIIFKNMMGIKKIKNGVSRVPLKVKYPAPKNIRAAIIFAISPNLL